MLHKVNVILIYLYKQPLYEIKLYDGKKTVSWISATQFSEKLKLGFYIPVFSFLSPMICSVVSG